MAQVTDNGKRRTVGSKVVSGFMPENPWESAPFIRGNPRLEKGGEKTIQKRLVNFRQRRISLGLRLVCLVVGLGLIGSLVGYGFAADNVEVTLTVTPVPTLSLTIDMATYAFGNIGVNTSTNSATALTLTNQSNVSVTLDKKITNESDPSGWTAGTTAGENTYVLYCATAAARIGLNDFASGTKFGALNNSTNLTNADGTTDPIIGPLGSVALWFKLDMPTTVSNSTARTITTRFTAAAE